MNNIKSNEKLSVLNHSCALLLAHAVKRLYPNAKFWVGPVIDEGFYYDMDLGDTKLSEDDLDKISKEMKKIAKSDKRISRVELSKEENLGYLKGTLEQKIQPYTEADIYTMEKIIDASGKNGKEVVQKLISLGMIEFKAATFLRGCSIDNSLVLVSECQNFSKDTFLKILTRIGTNSRYIFSAL